ncbi:MAG: hypothetical protein QOH93_2266 [Chloroflexia bacterium]|jgi:hypothetical protein|nr:hypothetical protein [Chloroflexia bacterium]
MAKQKNTVVGVFISEGHARGAIQKLRWAGLNAHIVNSSGMRAFKNTDLEAEVVQLYEGRMSEGNTIVMSHPGSKREQALDLMLESGAEYINLNTADSAAQAKIEATDRAAQETRMSTTQNAPSLQAARDHRHLDTTLREYGRIDHKTGHAKAAAEMHAYLNEEKSTPAGL